MGAMHGSSPGFLSVPMPNTFSMGWRYVRKYIHENKLRAPNRNVFEVLKKDVIAPKDGEIYRYEELQYMVM